MLDTPDNSPKSNPLHGWTLRCCDLDERHDLGLCANAFSRAFYHAALI
jgi:hypothetical protein